MQYRAIIKKSDGWWIGWLVDLPGVNAQEKTKKKLLESLRVCTKEMLEIPFEAKEEEELIKIEI
jgi:predicted RNase H-like HicB family nuclease